MNIWLALDRVAARRGDGLARALRALLRERAQMCDPNGKLTDIASARGTGPVQAGPSPAHKLPRQLPANVTPLAECADRLQNRAASARK